MKKFELVKFIFSQYEFLKDYRVDADEIDGKYLKGKASILASVRVLFKAKIIDIRYRDKMIDTDSYRHKNNMVRRDIRFLSSLGLMNEENYFIFVLLHEIGHVKFKLDMKYNYNISPKIFFKLNEHLINSLLNASKSDKIKGGCLNYYCGFLESFADRFAYSEFFRIYKLVNDIESNPLKYKLWEKNFSNKRIRLRTSNNPIKIVSVGVKESNIEIFSYNINFFSLNDLYMNLNDKGYEAVWKTLDKEKKIEFSNLAYELSHENLNERHKYFNRLYFKDKTFRYDISDYIKDEINLLVTKFHLEILE